MGKKVTIRLSKDGKIKVEAEGFQGASCEKATEFLDKIFGEADKEYKASYYEEDQIITEGLPAGWCG